MIDFNQFDDLLLWLVGVGTALLTIVKAVKFAFDKANEKDTKRICENEMRLKEILGKLDDVDKKISTCNDAVAFLMRREINDVYSNLALKRSCTKDEKHALLDMLQKYIDMGFNHIHRSFIEDVKKLSTDSLKCDYEKYD